VRPIRELRDLAVAGATAIDAPAVLLVELQSPASIAREFRTATLGDVAPPVPSLSAAATDPATRVAPLAKSGRNPYDGFLFLGRASTCDVIIRDSAISKTHAVIEPAGTGFYLRDNRSRNGTFRNAARLASGERVALASGDLILLGCYPLYFVVATELLRLLRFTARPSRS
jgi:hypothetical protein